MNSINKYNHSQKGKECRKRYEQSEKGKKTKKIRGWRLRGIICDDWDAMYQRYYNTSHCELCNVELISNKFSVPNRRCLDHDHSITDRENVRGIICQGCNSRDYKPKHNSKEYKKNWYEYQKTWGSRSNNCLLRIDVKLFM